MARPVLGPLNEATLKDPLAVIRKINREQVLKQGGGFDFYQLAVVVEIDPVGGLFSDPAEGLNPRMSIRARVLTTTVDGASPDMLRGADELKVCWPSDQLYHCHLPIKTGEKVWVFETNGIDGVTQRFWTHRAPSPSPLTLEPFVRPNNNYANASFEANLFQEADSDEIDVNRDATGGDTFDRAGSRNEGLPQTNDPETSTSYFSKVVDDKATKYGFVNEHIPEWFFRPSDTVFQGSNNSGILFGTNFITVESEEEATDIADIIQLYGNSNDASDFANANDEEVMTAEQAPIAAAREEQSSLTYIVAGRKFNIPSFTFDGATFAIFENVSVDNLVSTMADAITQIGGAPAEKAPASFLRSNHIRNSARESFAAVIGDAGGIYGDLEEGGRLILSMPGQILLKAGEATQLSLDSANATFTVPGDITFQAAAIMVPAPITFSGAATFSGPVTLPAPVAGQEEIAQIASALQTAAAALTAGGPVTAPVGAALQTAATQINNLSIFTRRTTEMP